MSHFFQYASRRLFSSLPVIVVLALSLTGCYTTLGTMSEAPSGQTTASATATLDASPSSDTPDRTQSSSTDTRDDVDAFFKDLNHYALKYLDSSDKALVKRATRLLKERSDSEISRAAYRDRLNNFRIDHPDFYGNFFGDPFYATYDLQYTRLAELRQRINTFVNPQNSVWSTASFYCSPYSYDPNFGGVCRGLQYAASDFFFLPSGSFSPVFSRPLSSGSDVALAGGYAPSPRHSLMSHGADVEQLSVESDRSPTDHLPSDGESAENSSVSRSIDSSSDEREGKLKVPSEVEALSSEEIASLTASLREGLSERERIALLRYLDSQRSIRGPSAVSSSGPRTNPDIALRGEVLRRAAQGRLYDGGGGDGRSTTGRSASEFSDLSSTELRNRVEDRISRRRSRSFDRTYSASDRSTRSDTRTRRTAGRSTDHRSASDARSSSSESSSSSSSSAGSSDSDQESSSSGRTGRERDDDSDR